MVAIAEYVEDVLAASAGEAAGRSAWLAALLGELADGETEAPTRGQLVQRLTAGIYQRYHCRDGRDTRERQSFERPEATQLLIDPDVRGAFETLLETDHYLDPGYRPLDPGIEWPRRFGKDGLVLLCGAEDVEAQPDNHFALKMPRVLPYRSRGFVTLVGARGPIAPDAKIARLYFSFDLSGSVAAARAFMTAADADGIGYTLKAIGKSGDYVRTDNMVAYIDARDFGRLRPTLAAVADENSGHVVHARPSIFCKQIANGISLAEEPGEQAPGQSFGQHRSRLLAEATARLLATGPLRDRDALEGAIRMRFSQDDVSVKVPYLSFSWTDAYA
jgi:hypothetical protein